MSDAPESGRLPPHFKPPRPGAGAASFGLRARPGRPALVDGLECLYERRRAALRDGEGARVGREGGRQTVALTLLPRGADGRRDPVEVRDEIALEATQHTLRVSAGLALSAEVFPAAQADSVLRARRDGPREAVAVRGVDEEGVGEQDEQQDGRRGRPPAEIAAETSSTQSWKLPELGELYKIAGNIAITTAG